MIERLEASLPTAWHKACAHKADPCSWDATRFRFPQKSWSREGETQRGKGGEGLKEETQGSAGMYRGAKAPWET